MTQQSEVFLRIGTLVVEQKNNSLGCKLRAQRLITQLRDADWNFRFKNAQWNTCIKLQQGWNSDGCVLISNMTFAVESHH
jgi:hypothetical protein